MKPTPCSNGHRALVPEIRFRAHCRTCAHMPDGAAARSDARRAGLCRNRPRPEHVSASSRRKPAHGRAAQPGALPGLVGSARSDPPRNQAASGLARRPPDENIRAPVPHSSPPPRRRADHATQWRTAFLPKDWMTAAGLARFAVGGGISDSLVARTRRLMCASPGGLDRPPGRRCRRPCAMTLLALHTARRLPPRK